VSRIPFFSSIVDADHILNQRRICGVVYITLKRATAEGRRTGWPLKHAGMNNKSRRTLFLTALAGHREQIDNTVCFANAMLKVQWSATHDTAGENHAKPRQRGGQDHFTRNALSRRRWSSDPTVEVARGASRRHYHRTHRGRRRSVAS
jgi:hypothetical protein